MTLHQFKAFCFRGETGANLHSHQLRAADTDRLPSWCCSAIRIHETWSASSLPASPRAVNIETGPTRHGRYNKNKGSSFELKSSHESKIACRNKNKSNETALLVFMCVQILCTAFSLHATVMFPTLLIWAFPSPVELFKVTEAAEVLLHFASTLVLHTLHPWQRQRQQDVYRLQWELPNNLLHSASINITCRQIETCIHAQLMRSFVQSFPGSFLACRDDCCTLLASTLNCMKVMWLQPLLSLL